MEPLYRNCPHRLEYADARTQDGAFIDDGTCTYSLALSGGAVVSTGALAKVTGVAGLYRGQIPAADLAAITIGAVYVATISFSAPGDLADERTINYRAARRGSN